MNFPFRTNLLFLLSSLLLIKTLTNIKNIVNVINGLKDLFNNTLQFLYVFLYCIIFCLNKNELNWTERLAKIWNLGNAKLQTRNCKLRFAVCGLRFAVCLRLKVSNNSRTCPLSAVEVLHPGGLSVVFIYFNGLFTWTRLTRLARFPRTRRASKSFVKISMCSYERAG